MWQPIETAPETLERCLLYCDDPIALRNYGGVVLGRFMFGTPYGNGMNGDWHFSHWMPLPDPPTKDE